MTSSERFPSFLSSFMTAALPPDLCMQLEKDHTVTRVSSKNHWNPNIASWCYRATNSRLPSSLRNSRTCGVGFDAVEDVGEVGHHKLANMRRLWQLVSHKPVMSERDLNQSKSRTEEELALGTFFIGSHFWGDGSTRFHNQGGIPEHAHGVMIVRVLEGEPFSWSGVT
jgi:hypothetical protein